MVAPWLVHGCSTGGIVGIRTTNLWYISAFRRNSPAAPTQVIMTSRLVENLVGDNNFTTCLLMISHIIEVIFKAYDVLYSVCLYIFHVI